MAIVINGTGIDMGGNHVSNASQLDSTVINQNGDNVTTISDLNTAGIALKTIATGTATFTATTNNINLTGIGVGVEIGDVIQISGADDAKNNSEFTIEVITDANNIIVNQAHANKGTTKNVANRSGDTGVTVKLLAKWYNAGAYMGRGRVNMTSSRTLGTTYTNNTRRPIVAIARFSLGTASGVNLTIGSEVSGTSSASVILDNTLSEIILPYETYRADKTAGTASILSWHELR